MCKRWAFDDASEPCKRKQLALIFVSHSLNDVYAWTWNLKLEEMIEYISVGITAAPVLEGFSSIELRADESSADVNFDGAVDVADIASVISIMAANARAVGASQGE